MTATSIQRRTPLNPTVMIGQFAVLMLIVAVLYRHVLTGLVYSWKNNSDWSHGFIIPFFSLYFLYTQRHRFPATLRNRNALPQLAGAALLVLSFGLFIASIFYKMEYPKRCSLLLSMLAVILMVWGWPVFRWSWFAVAFLMFAVPLPHRVFQELTMPLRGVAAVVSAMVLQFIPDMFAEAHGTVVEYIYRGQADVLDVERACSGMRLLMTMMALGVAMAFMHDRPLWQRLVMVLSCVPIAIFCNVVRVTLTGLLVVFGRADLAHGTWHTLMGLGMLFVAFALYGAISYVLNHLFVEEAEADESVAATGGLGG
ncbi:MAG: exosortase/archaeosortase family protein [Phycisphaerales bacterium]|nr:exosortase/archaeosortase family protein [Phycisphaerales bacterium]